MPRAECDSLLRDVGGRDCTLPDTGRCFLSLPPSCDTPKSTLPLPSTYGRSCPDLGHIRLPDLIRSCCFHTTPLFLSSCAQPSRANQQAALAHHPQHSFAIHPKPFLPVQPPGHSAITVSWFFSAGLHDLFIPLPIRSTAPRLLPVVQARSADHQCRGHHRRRVSLFDQRSRLGVNFTTAHSPTTFFRISISSDFRPRLRSSCRIRRSFSA